MSFHPSSASARCFAFSRHRGAWLVLVVLSAATGCVAHLLARAGDRLSSSCAAQQADAAAAAWTACLQRYETAIDATRAFFAASERVEAGEWRLFTRTLLDGRYPGLTAIAFVDDAEAAAPRYATPSAGDGAHRPPAAEDVRAVIAQARARDDLAFAVARNGAGGEAGAQILAAAGVAPGREGWIVACLSADALLGEATRGRLEGVVALSLAEGGSPLALRRDGVGVGAELVRTRDVRHRDRTWALELRVAPPIEARLYHSLVPYVVLAGLLIGLLAFVVIAHLDAVRARLTALIGDLREARLAAEVASEAKLLFLANMSHEIRTPLNGVLGTSGLLLECELSGEDRELAEAVRASACELHDRLELILDFVKVETDQLDLEAVELEPRKELETVVGLLAPWAASKRLTLRCELDAGLPAVILADARRLRQILFQIAGNAVKFTDQGEVVLRATLLSGREPEAEATLRFEVQDTGPGIPPAERERMLAAFAMRDATMTRRHRGLGLGLSLSHRLVRLMGGELDVTSASGRGTGIGFTLRRPVRRWRPGPSVEAAPALRPGDTSAPEATRPARGLRVLVVEDNPVNQRVTASVLRHAGHEVRTAETGTAAVSAVGEERFDVVLMDCQMPEMDGYEATRRIRALEEGGGRTPIIALTAHDLKGDRERCLRAGMDDYLAKPVSPERLLARIRAWTEAPLASVTL